MTSNGSDRVGNIRHDCGLLATVVVISMAAVSGQMSVKATDVSNHENGADRPKAVRAILTIRRTDPSRAKWCLERLVPLYEKLSKDHPAVLEHLLSLADTLNELALLRIDTLDTALRRGELDPVGPG